MNFGLAVSIFAHAALLIWALVTIRSTPELLAPKEDPIEVALIDPSEFLRLKKGATDVSELEAKAKNAEKPDQSVKEADKPKPVEAEKPPEPPPVEESKPKEPDPIAEKIAEAPPPPPGPTPEEKKLLEEKLEKERLDAEKKKADEDAKKKAEEKKKAAADRKKRIEDQRKKMAEKKRLEEEKKKKEATAADRLAALLDKDPTKRGAENAAPDPSKPTDYTGRTAGANRGDDTVLSAREQDLLVSQIRSQIRECWRLPGGGGGIETTVVVLSWHLRPDGSLEGEPEVMNRQSDPVYGIAAEAAIRAVKSCSPFRLPPDMYDGWKFIDEWRFDPREML